MKSRFGLNTFFKMQMMMMVMTLLLTMRVMKITKKMKDYEVHARIEHLVSLYAGDLLDLHEKFLSPTKQKQIELSQHNTLLEED